MGGGGVGKSALTIRFVHQLFVEKYDPTIEDSYRRNLNVDGVMVSLEVLDTAGTEQASSYLFRASRPVFMSLSSMYMRSGDGFLLVFSLTNSDSLLELHAIHEQIQRIKETARPPHEKARVPIVLVGNKLDLVSERQVNREAAVAVSQSWGGVPYYETSARREINVTEIFADVVRQMVKSDLAFDSQSNGTRSTRNGHAGHRARKKRCTIL
ncbi:hypothetical protein BMF94_1548 [Rhodotorula taiwanensis]|uniref:Small monomeric GTPase n=1 Tax=Rhodotorula taiwanensis TaxID=741276 RepID=A0A2S5BF55_9BASI|nr:hypothetical protein BMF94_1548 [Rhodotorula taiwanensis]